MNRQASRTGGSDESFLEVSSPQTETDSNQGNAIVTPIPRRNIRRETERVEEFVAIVILPT